MTDKSASRECQVREALTKIHRINLPNLPEFSYMKIILLNNNNSFFL